MDNTCGSGTFLVAAAMEGRNFIGIEKNENVALFKTKPVDYIEVSKNRILKVVDFLEKNNPEKLSKIEAVNLLKELK